MPRSIHAQGTLARSLALLALLVGLDADIAGAQFGDPFRPVIAGRQVQCMSAIGQPVAFVPNPMLNDIGQSNPGFPPTIQLNPVILTALPVPLQLFWWGHECGHHALGHTLGLSDFTREAAADCWAIQKGKEAGVLTRRDVEAFEPYFRNNPGSPWGHLPGPNRIALFLRCFDGAGGAPQQAASGGDSCVHARDGECDEPELCDRGTDTTDCRGGAAAPNSGSGQHGLGGTGAAMPSLPNFCCTPAGRLGPYPNPGANGIPVMVGQPCVGMTPMGFIPGQACP